MDLTWFEGKKTYLTAIAIICYALGGMFSGYVEIETGIILILGALGLSSLGQKVQRYLDLINLDEKEVINKQ